MPLGCDWFRRDGYRDYLALPIIQDGEFKGAVAWSTKAKDGFGEPQIQGFRESLTALSAVLRLYTNYIVLRTLTNRLEDGFQVRTAELQTANAQLEKATNEIAEQAQRQLQPFAMMREAPAGSFFGEFFSSLFSHEHPSHSLRSAGVTENQWICIYA